jgi:hypothetical protein
VHVEIGPLSSASAHAWVDYARGVIKELRDSGGKVDGPQTVTMKPDVLDAFSTYLDQWDAAANAGETFRWAGDADPEVVEYLLHAWFNLAKSLLARNEERGTGFAPDESRPFYNAMVVALLDALEGEGQAPTIAFAEELREFWPGLDLGKP